jgi:hypothetical protein
MTANGYGGNGRVNGHAGLARRAAGDPPTRELEPAGGLDAPPHDLDAERYTLAALLDASQRPDLLEEITGGAGEFYRPCHGELFSAIVWLHAASEPVDPVSLRAAIGAEIGWRAFGGEGRGCLLLAELGGMPVPNGRHHARLVHAAWLRRLMTEAGAWLAQRAHTADADPYEALAAVVSKLDGLCRETARPGALGPMTLAEFISRDWGGGGELIVPGLLGQQDRAVIVAPEGAGKTTVLLQFGVASAAGIHPLVQTPIAPVRVLWLDAENPRYHASAELAKMLGCARRHGSWDGRNFHIWSRPRGVDLWQAEGRAQLASVIRAVRPQLVIGGPQRKLLRGDGRASAEVLHGTLADFFDDMRERHGFALMLETHMPAQMAGSRREGRPIGWSGYQSWPEFGFFLKPGKGEELGWERFRKDRIRGRNWPAALEPNRAPGGGWPWVARYDNRTAPMPGWEAEQDREPAP